MNKINTYIHNENEEINRIKKLEILSTFLNERTIKFILENNNDLINKISLQSLVKSIQLYSLTERSNTIKKEIKWLPILLDYDRTYKLISILKKKNVNSKEALKILEKSLNDDIQLADNYNINDNIELNNEDYIKYIQEMDILNSSKINNEIFKNMIDFDIKKYDGLLRKLK